MRNRITLLLIKMLESRVALPLICILALAVRIGIGVFLGFNSPPDKGACGADTVEMEQMAWSSSQGHGFQIREGSGPSAFRAPGYPMMLSAAYSVLGHKYWINRLMLSVVGMLACLCVYLLVVRMGLGRATASIAALLCAVLPGQFYFAGHFMSEVPSIFFNVLSTLIMVIAMSQVWNRDFTSSGLRHETRAAVMMLVAGIVCGFSTLVRPASQVVPLALAFLLLVTRHTAWRRRILWPALMVVGLLIAVSPWAIRNYRVFDRFCLVSTNGGSTFWGSNNETVATPSSGKWGTRISTNFDPEKKKQVWALPNEVDRDKLEWQFGREFLRDNPGKVPMLIIGKFYRLLTPFPQSSNRIYVLAIAAGHIFLLPLAIAGMIIALRKSSGRWRFIPANAQILTLLVTTVIFYGSERFRMAYEPFLAVYAAVAIVALFQRALSGRSREAVVTQS